MSYLTAERLQAYRERTFRLQPGSRLQSVEDALQFVNERGFVYFWPIKGIVLPSLWAAVAGERPVADEHDDPGHVTWRWKDSMLDRRQWYYAKILRGKATMVALEVAPAFYALSENYGDPENDYLAQYEDGLLSREAKVIYEALLREGPLDSVNLRRVTHMTGKASNSPFERGLVSLQRDFKILPVGVSEAGAWRYSFVYDLVHRTYPDLPGKARPIGRRAAQEKLVKLYLVSVGAATEAEVRKLFQWRRSEVARSLQALETAGIIRSNWSVEGRSDEFYVAASLVK